MKQNTKKSNYQKKSENDDELNRKREKFKFLCEGVQ